MSDIILTFFKIIKEDGVIKKQEPVEVALDYLSWEFAFDVVSVMPFSVWKPQFVFLRFLKANKFLEYQKYFNRFIAELLQSQLNSE